MSKSTTPARLLSQLSGPARRRYATDAAWAQAAGVPKETLSRIKTRDSCDLRTLDALARAAACELVAVPVAAALLAPERFGRAEEDLLLDLAASGNTDAAVWRSHGPGFFMGGVCVLLASSRAFDRERYLRLAEELHPGVSTPEVFGMWLEASPVQPARFLPMARRRRELA